MSTIELRDVGPFQYSDFTDPLPRERAKIHFMLWKDNFYRVEGGLWVCPHIPVYSMCFFNEIFELICTLHDQSIDRRRLTCNVCFAQIELEETHRMNHNKTDQFKISLRIEVLKSLGSMEQLVQSASIEETLAPHCSMRLIPCFEDIQRA